MYRLRTASRNRSFYRTFLFLFTTAVCRAVLVNRTIDSSFGDPVTGFVPIYQPQYMWQTCPSSNCLQLDTAKAFNGTWTVADYYPGPGLQNATVTLQFTGVAIWVFFILLDFSNSPYINNTNVNITLDGQYARTFSHHPDNITDLIYNATIFSTSGLANTSHELVIGMTQDYLPVDSETGYYLDNWLIFDWAIYTVDDGRIPSSQSTSSSTSVAFPSTTGVAFPSTTGVALPSTTSVAFPSSSITSVAFPSSSTTSVAFPSSSTTSSSSTASMTPTSSSKIGVIVGCTLGGLAVITLVLVLLVRRLRRAPPVKAEGVLDINVPPHHQPYRYREIPLSVHEPSQSKAARVRLREARQRELDERILSTQHELDNLRSLRNARSADETSDPSAAGPSQPSPELALLRNEMRQLRDYLQAQRESDWAQGLSNEPLPPAYAQLSNDVR